MLCYASYECATEMGKVQEGEKEEEEKREGRVTKKWFKLEFSELIFFLQNCVLVGPTKQRDTKEIKG